MYFPPLNTFLKVTKKGRNTEKVYHMFVHILLYKIIVQLLVHSRVFFA